MTFVLVPNATCQAYNLSQTEPIGLIALLTKLSNGAISYTPQATPAGASRLSSMNLNQLSVVS